MLVGNLQRRRRTLDGQVLTPHAVPASVQNPHQMVRYKIGLFAADRRRKDGMGWCSFHGFSFSTGLGHAPPASLHPLP
jgi:hypothetical protein